MTLGSVKFNQNRLDLSLLWQSRQLAFIIGNFFCQPVWQFKLIKDKWMALHTWKTWNKKIRHALLIAYLPLSPKRIAWKLNKCSLKDVYTSGTKFTSKIFITNCSICSCKKYVGATPFKNEDRCDLQLLNLWVEIETQKKFLISKLKICSSRTRKTFCTVFWGKTIFLSGWIPFFLIQIANHSPKRKTNFVCKSVPKIGLNSKLCYSVKTSNST